MKKLYFIFLFITTTLFAQVPQGFSYQAVALNASGNAVASSPVRIRVTILEGSATGTATYIETHNPTTNNLGLFTLTIGQGTPSSGTFATINWSQNSKFLKVEIDVANGTNYVTVGSSQLLSVPYAMFAGAVAGVSGGISETVFTDLYLYGTFNFWDSNTALRLNGTGSFYGYKYLTAGSQFKFINALGSSAAYGNGGNGLLALNGSAFTVNANGIYYISANNFGHYEVYSESVAVGVQPSFSTPVPMTYNANTNTLSCTVVVPDAAPVATRQFNFSISAGITYGDNLADGFLDRSGADIRFPGTGTYLITLNLNTTGDGSPYTVVRQ
jgi:hypothetical protein